MAQIFRNSKLLCDVYENTGVSKGHPHGWTPLVWSTTLPSPTTTPVHAVLGVALNYPAPMLAEKCVHQVASTPAPKTLLGHLIKLQCQILQGGSGGAADSIRLGMQ
eukprot:1147193-Pelagomonas_calceolata.AAC.2